MTSSSQPLRADAFAEFLGARVERLGDGQAQARLQIADEHLNPHGTTHGTVIYSIAGIALAAAANSPTRSGIVSSVHIDYLAPVFLGDHLMADVSVAEATRKEDLFVGRVIRVDSDSAAEGETVARISARATRRARSEASE